jgi:uncharacterized protein DUF2877
MPEPMVASVLCTPLLDGPPQPLRVVHSSSVAFQLADAAGKVRLCLATQAAVRLPSSVVVGRLPVEADDVWVGGGRLRWGRHTYRPARWWTPHRPHLPALLPKIRTAVDRLIADWRPRLGRGDGLTPYDDDVTCGALVTLRAAGDPRAQDWSRDVLHTPLEQATTATSAALLRSAAEGWCIDAVAGYLARRATDQDASSEKAALVRVGASSGRGLLEGITVACGARTSRAAV